MEKRVVIAGCRNYFDYAQAKKYIDLCLKNIRKQFTIIIISGGCRGADMIGLRYATENNMTFEVYNADWIHFGKAAGPLRNRHMAEVCDYVICFWDGKSKGTFSMIQEAKKLNNPLHIKYI